MSNLSEPGTHKSADSDGVTIRAKRSTSLKGAGIFILLGLTPVLATLGREDALERGGLRGPAWGFYHIVPYMLPALTPLSVIFILIMIYDLIFSRSLNINSSGVTSRFWKLSWHEIMGISVREEKLEKRNELVNSIVVFHVTPEAHAQEKSKNRRDSPRAWAFRPPEEYEIHSPNTLEVPGTQLATYLWNCREYYLHNRPTHPQQRD